MAAMNGPQFVSCMLRRKDRLDFTSTLQDPRQWPTLGQSSDAEQKKKTTPFGNSSSNSTGKAASSSRIKGDGPAGTDQRSAVKPASSSVTSDTPSSSSTSDHTGQNHHCQTDSSNSSNHEDGSTGTGEDALQRRNSVAKRGGKKTTWKKLDIPAPPSRAAMQDKLRTQQRQEGYGAAYRPDYRFRPSPPAAASQLPTANNNAPARAAPVPAQVTNNQTVSAGANSAAAAGSSTAAAANQPFRNGSVQTDYTRRFKKPLPPAPVHNTNFNRPRIARKMQGFRHRDMTYDGDYMGGDGHSDVADDASQHENGDGYRHTDSGYNSAWQDWSSSSYYDGSYGVDGYAQGYQAHEYPTDGYGYYAGEVPGLHENGLYIPASPMAAYVSATVAPLDNAELREMIKYQIEYYFSPDNLQKDFFLRRMMAKDGSVMLGLVASFQRVRALSQDFNLIIESIVDSERVELMDNFMIRPRDAPEQWPIEEEDEKNTGYYYINGETDDYGSGSSATYSLQMAGCFTDETDESGTGEDVASHPDEDEEEEEEVSVDGSDLSEVSVDVRRQLVKLKPEGGAGGHHHHDALQAMSEKFLQQVM